jgi:6-pyruvoyltetrahydropterin/6-carboxytetrahydropterin synthase
MHKLLRQVRFSINPFGPVEQPGRNSFASNPPGEGLAIYFSLWVEIAGKINPDTGFVINVIEIDRLVRERAVPIFGGYIREKFLNKSAISFDNLAEFLKNTWQVLETGFPDGQVKSLALELSPFRKIAIETQKAKTMIISEKFEFAATHTLWNEKFSKEENFRIFGKCANPTGHGHNYVLEVCMNIVREQGWIGIGEMERIVDENVIAIVDHKNLNVDVAEFSKTVPTVENIAVFAWKRLDDKLGPNALKCINVWETDKTYCSYCGQ